MGPDWLNNHSDRDCTTPYLPCHLQELIDLHSLDLEICQIPVSAWQGCSGPGQWVGAGGSVRVAVKRTYGVTEAWIVQSFYRSIARLNEFNNHENDNVGARLERRKRARRTELMQPVSDYLFA